MFAYLKPMPVFGSLLQHLGQLQVPTIVFSQSPVDPVLRQHCEDRFPTLSFSSEPVDLVAASSECDIGIGNASHGFTAAMLRAGKPNMMFPLHYEQQITARNVVHMGAGVALRPDDVSAIPMALHRVISDETLGRSAFAFATKYADLDCDSGIGQAVDAIETLVRAS